MTSQFFEVDKAGLAKLAERRGKAFVLYELLQNAWDTDAREVNITFYPVEGRPLVNLVVEDDDPEGFKNLTHAWTLFAESEKKTDATKRGRFNLGEKLVLALCQEAEIITKTGGVLFDAEGRHISRKRTIKGSVFRATVRMTRAEYDEACEAVKKVIVPTHIVTYFNGNQLPFRNYIGNERLSLQTEIADEEGYLRRTSRVTKITMYNPFPGEVGTLFEMGIPVMETGDRYHVDVHQKVPLNMERDGVSPAYLRALRAATLNTMSHEINTPEAAAAPWVRDAMAHDSIESGAVQKVMDTRFGTERVVFDPSDREANNIAMSRGMTVVPGAAMSKEEWVNVRRYEALKPAGQVTPSPKPFSPSGEPLVFIFRDSWSNGQQMVAALAKRIGLALLNVDVQVNITNTRSWAFAATYSPGDLILNWSKIGSYDAEQMIELILHEYAHHYESNHLAEGFHEACCRLGAKLAVLAVNNQRLVTLE